MTRPARVPAAIRDKYRDAFVQILLAEPWPLEALPVRAELSGRRMSRKAQPYYVLSVITNTSSDLLGPDAPAAAHIGQGSFQRHESRLIRRLNACAREAWMHGIRRLDLILHPAEFRRASAHELIAAEIAASKWDQET